MQKKVLIIGGGMAGLSAGAYLRMNGFDAEIFELGSRPGGVCTSWQRDDYTVDWCVHWLIGSGPADSFYERWSELVDMESLKIVDHEEFFRVEDEAGNVVRIFTDVDRLESELLEKAPEDEKAIREFTGKIRKLTHFQMPHEQSFEVANLWYKMKYMWKMLPYMGVFGKFSRVSTAEYAEKFRNPLLRKAIANLFEPETPIIFCMMTLAWMHNKAAGYPVGGSLNFAGKIADRFLSLGGKLHLDSRVKKILTEDGLAKGIQLENGEQYSGNYVVSAADGHSTLFGMLDGKFNSDKYDRYFAGHPTFPSLVFVALGVNRDLSGFPHSTIFPLKDSLVIDPETKTRDLWLRIHNFDPTLTPKGKTLVTVMLETRNFQYWVDLEDKDPELYQKEKQRIAVRIIDVLENKYGNFREQVEMIDVSTPATIIHYTGNWKGSFEGWLLTPETGFEQLPSTLPGLQNFYMCGHWVVVGGGLPTAMMSGRNVAQLICKKEKIDFTVLQQELKEV